LGRQGWALLATLLLLPGCSDRAVDPAASRPNVVFILADDLGYADVGPFGAVGIETPSIDRLAREGMRLTSFYAAPTCTPARAMLMTGSYGERVSVPGAFFPFSSEGLHPDEITLAEVLRDQGYATGMVGKWHLGHHPPFLPTAQGFEEYFGIPYSNDMGRMNLIGQAIYPDLPLIEGQEVVEREPDQSELTLRYTERAVDFIARHAGEPFFLYVAHSMPHWPIAASAGFAGRSSRGVYGDVITEIDWSVGEILRALEASGIDDRTLVWFASDNGPWLIFGNHAGTAGVLREGKGTTFEGGVRVPSIARWPGRIPSGSESSEPVGLIDVLPTVAILAGGEPPSDRAIDGRDIWPILSGAPGARSPHDAWWFYREGGLEALRSERWKLHVPHGYASVAEPGNDGAPGITGAGQIDLALYDLETDPAESSNVAAAHGDVVERLLALVEAARSDLGDRLTQRTGPGVRPAGRFEPAP
jgi:arylsulfatase A-like enzyme